MNTHYIGETMRRQHKEACIRGQTDKSAIAEHAGTEDHPINWNDTKILQGASYTMELVMKKALCLKPANARFNRDSGYELPDCWIALNKKLKGRALVEAPALGAHTTLRNYQPKSQSHVFRAAYKSINLVSTFILTTRMARASSRNVGS